MTCQGYLKPSILYFLMRIGTATPKQLASCIGTARMYVRKKLNQMQAEGLVAPSAESPEYALTKAGIAAALYVSKEDVERA